MRVHSIPDAIKKTRGLVFQLDIFLLSYVGIPNYPACEGLTEARAVRVSEEGSICFACRYKCVFFSCTCATESCNPRAHGLFEKHPEVMRSMGSPFKRKVVFLGSTDR